MFLPFHFLTMALCSCVCVIDYFLCAVCAMTVCVALCRRWRVQLCGIARREMRHCALWERAEWPIWTGHMDCRRVSFVPTNICAWLLKWKCQGKHIIILLFFIDVGGTFSRGTELCTVVEAMFSYSTLFSVFGDVSFIERTERIAVNALPAAWASPTGGDIW